MRQSTRGPYQAGIVAANVAAGCMIRGEVVDRFVVLPPPVEEHERGRHHERAYEEGSGDAHDV